jgi:radical SAM superfamily enzyme YgiQ (UPF0313 family)
MRICLVVYDNESFIHWFPIGLAYITAVLEKAGIEVAIYNQDVHHWPDEHLTAYLDANPFDIVGYSTIGGYYQYKKLLSVSKAINASKKRPIFMLGGHGPTPEPEYFLKKTGADIIVLGEGEETILEVVEAIGKRQSLVSIEGIAYRIDENVFVNPRRATILDIDSIPFPAYHRFPIDYYRLLRMPHCSSTDFVMPILSGRGCPFHCNFCYRMDDGFRARSTEAIVEEIQFLKKEYRITYIAFGDELLMSSPARTENLCQTFIKAGLNIKWDCNGRLNYAKTDLLSLMKEAGCVFINYGIEAMDDQILQTMNKALTVKQIVNGIEATMAVGISPGFNIIFGNIGENRETLNKGVEFLLRYDDQAQFRNIRPVTPYPGTDLYKHAIKTGLLKDCEDFYERKHLNSDMLAINFTSLTDEEFYDALYEANKRLFVNYYDKLCVRSVEVLKKLYKELDPEFRGFRHG